MSYTSGSLVPCENLQDDLKTGWMDGQIRPSQDSSRFLGFLNSDLNTRDVVQEVSPGSGKARTVKLKYEPRIPESAVIEEDGRNCGVSDERVDRYQDYTIDTEDVISVGEKRALKDLTRVCKENPMYFAGRIAALMDVIDRKVASQTAGEAAALVGNWSAYVTGDSSTFTMSGDKLQVSTKSSGQIVPGAWENIQAAAESSGITDIFGFGGSLMREYLNMTMNGCCANQGLSVIDIYNQFGFAYAYDPRLAEALGSLGTESLIVQPGAFQLLTYTQNDARDGMPALTPGGYSAGVAVTPAGVPVDVIITDECPGTIAIKVIACTKLIALPSDMYYSGDTFEGVNKTAAVTVSNS